MDYTKIWDDYWQDSADALDQVFWDSPPEQAVRDDLRRLGAHLDAALPVIDVGCGHGTQTRELAARFARVVGVDVSPAGLAIARAVNPADNLEYETLDVLDADACARLHARLGDANVYMRTVLHQLAPDERTRATAGLATLLGARGRALVAELSPAAEAYFEYLFAEYGGPPPGLSRVLRHGIRPAALQLGDLARAFAAHGLAALAQDKSAVRTTLTLPGGHAAMVPMDVAVFARV
ncbi:MAG: class I SAM-dependent methyltransferase [Myxococcales bacterium]|nr:class I SAM-dependent methyltransferase [Myxococcales bacterium]